MTSIHPLGAVKPWTRRPGLAVKQGQRESFRVPEGIGNGWIKLPRIDGMRYATRSRCWVQLSMSPAVHPVLESSRVWSAIWQVLL